MLPKCIAARNRSLKQIDVFEEQKEDIKLISY